MKNASRHDRAISYRRIAAEPIGERRTLRLAVYLARRYFKFKRGPFTETEIQLVKLLGDALRQTQAGK